MLTFYQRMDGNGPRVDFGPRIHVAQSGDRGRLSVDLSMRSAIAVIDRSIDAVSDRREVERSSIAVRLSVQGSPS